MAAKRYQKAVSEACLQIPTQKKKVGQSTARLPDQGQRLSCRVWTKIDGIS